MAYPVILKCWCWIFYCSTIKCRNTPLGRISMSVQFARGLSLLLKWHPSLSCGHCMKGPSM